jgi:hypothetical protein
VLNHSFVSSANCRDSVPSVVAVSFMFIKNVDDKLTYERINMKFFMKTATDFSTFMEKNNKHFFSGVK